MLLKGKLVQLYKPQLENYDIEQLDYLVRLIDDFLLDRLPLTSENFNILMGDIISTAVMQVNFDLLDFVKPYVQIGDELSGKI